MHSTCVVNFFSLLKCAFAARQLTQLVMENMTEQFRFTLFQISECSRHLPDSLSRSFCDIICAELSRNKLPLYFLPALMYPTHQFTRNDFCLQKRTIRMHITPLSLSEVSFKRFSSCSKIDDIHYVGSNCSCATRHEGREDRVWLVARGCQVKTKEESFFWGGATNWLETEIRKRYAAERMQYHPDKTACGQVWGTSIFGHRAGD